ncbi:MAG: AbrB/MazE/SpoVT family DNA-binding domain-containing protein [Cyanobacteria bacterium M_surface_7_m2_040]|nr:AbrB/MazE/SpoVT family DNA-binding domain-containing protein [Cyanobacteria bacterium M_surface_7_m2_040]
MRITSKGQVTIPQAIREQAGLSPSCEVVFRLVDGQVLLEKVDPSGQQRGAEALALLRARPSRSGLSTDAILALARGTSRGDAAV